MSCAKYRWHLDELASGELAPRLQFEVRAHVERCAACRRRYDETRATLSLLRRLGNEKLPEDFGASLHRKLIATPSPRRVGRWRGLWQRLEERLWRRPLVSGLAGAGLAGLIVVGFLILHQPLARRTPVAAGQVAPIFVVPEAKVAMVRIDFLAEEAVEDVEFAIQLAEGLYFISEGRELPEREFRWRGRLERGSNPIPVAVRGKRAGRYTLTAHAVGPDVRARHDVVLEVTSS